jgi:magnesium-transporting ATPase (P-type)
MMTHVFQTKKARIIAAKGAPKSLRFPTSTPSRAKFTGNRHFSFKGYRILGVCYTEFKGTNTKNQKISLSFLWDWWFSMTRQSQYSTCNPAVL